MNYAELGLKPAIPVCQPNNTSFKPCPLSTLRKDCDCEKVVVELFNSPKSAYYIRIYALAPNNDHTVRIEMGDSPTDWNHEINFCIAEPSMLSIWTRREQNMINAY